MAALGDERLFELLERDGDAIARGDEAAFASGAVAELVERAAWAKVEVVDGRREGAGRDRRPDRAEPRPLARPRVRGGGRVRRRCSTARRSRHGLRAACRIGEELGVTPPARRSRIEALLDALGLATSPLPCPLDAVMAALATDKKHAGGGLRWVLPTADGYEVRSDVPVELVERVAAGLLASGAGAGAAAGRAS